MLEKHSVKAIAATVALAMLATSMVSVPAYSEHRDLDSFGIKKIYPTKDSNEWYVNMNDPRNDPHFKNLQNVQFSKNADGSWRVYADQIRMEAWSPTNDKWLNVEITAYAKIESGSNDLLQLYSRGGHHTSKDECLGSAYKARLYGDGRAAWNKEITHPAYAGNRGEVRVTTEPLEDRWVGFKAVIYNIEENGKTYVRLESYIDDDVTDSKGNLVVKNNWKLASTYEDKGGWASNNSDFNSSCGRDRDEILTRPGGTNTQNIAAFRTDGITWSFKYLSVREITLEEEPSVNELVEDPTGTIDSYSCACALQGQHIPNEDETTTINRIEILGTRDRLARGTATVSIVQDGNEIASDEVTIRSSIYDSLRLRAGFDDVQVTGDFDVIISFKGRANIYPETGTDLNIEGNYFSAEGEFPTSDLNIRIR